MATHNPTRVRRSAHPQPGTETQAPLQPLDPQVRSVTMRVKVGTSSGPNALPDAVVRHLEAQR